MATSNIQIVNTALTLLGDSRITSLSDNTKPAREANAIYEPVRNALLAAYNWSFAKKRDQLSADVTAPDFGWDKSFTLPADCLRILFVGDYYVGLDLTDYRGSPVEEFEIEGRKILTDWPTPLNLKYIGIVTDTTTHPATFDMALSMRLAELLAEPLTQSDTKRARAADAFKSAIKDAIRANAIELPPVKLPDDEWVISRL